jgi:hypothetical protein
MPEISIITPVYQAEKFLKKCVDSILSQSFTDWELLLVDDGSTDKSSEICRTYAEQDARIRYHQKENGGVSSARNAGVALAEGRYITFVDSDDFAAEDLLETLYRLAEKYDAEMSICRGYDLYEGRPVPDLKQEGIESVTDSEEGLRQVMKARVFGVMPWGKLYRREIFEGVVYPEKTIAEDAYVIVPLMEHCRKVAFSTAQKYYYVHRRESLTTSGFRWSDLGSVEVWDHNQNVVEERPPALKKEAGVRCCWARFFVLDKLMLLETMDAEKKALAKRLAKELKKHPLLVLEGDHFTNGRKIAYLTLFLGTGIYRQCVRALFRKRNL